MTTTEAMLAPPNDIEQQTYADNIPEALNSEDFKTGCEDRHGNLTLSLEEAAEAMLSHHIPTHTACRYPEASSPKDGMEHHSHEDTRLPSHDTQMDATPEMASPADYAIIPAGDFAGDMYPFDDGTPEGSPDGSGTDDTSNDKARAIQHVSSLVPAQRKRLTTREEHGGAFQPSRMGERGGLKIYGRSHVFIANFDARWASHLSWQTSPPTEFLNYLCAFIESKSRDLGGVDRLRSTRSKERFFQVRRFGYIERGESGQFNFVRFKCIAVHQGGGNWQIHDDAWRALLAFDLRNGDFAFAAQTARALAPKQASEGGSAQKRRKTTSGAILDTAGPSYTIPAEAAASYSPQIPDGRTEDHSPSLALVPVSAHASTAPPKTQKEGKGSHQHSQSPPAPYTMSLNQGYPPHHHGMPPHLAPTNTGGAPTQYGYGMHHPQHQQQMPWGYYPYPGGPPPPSHMPQMYYPPPASFDGRTMQPPPMYPFPPPLHSSQRGGEGGHPQSDNGQHQGLPSEFAAPSRPSPLPVSPPLITPPPQAASNAADTAADAAIPGQVRTAVDIMNSLFAGQQDYPSPTSAAAAGYGQLDDDKKPKKEMTFAEIASGLEETPPVSATPSQSGSAPPPRSAGAAFASFPSRLSSCSVVSLCAFLDQAHQLIREGLALLKKTGWLSTPESLIIMRELAKFDKGHYSRLAVLAGEVSDYKSSATKLDEAISSEEGNGGKKRKRSALKDKEDLLARLGGAFASFLPSPEAEQWRETHIEEIK